MKISVEPGYHRNNGPLHDALYGLMHTDPAWTLLIRYRTEGPDHLVNCDPVELDSTYLTVEVVDGPRKRIRLSAIVEVTII